MTVERTAAPAESRFPPLAPPGAGGEPVAEGPPAAPAAPAAPRAPPLVVDVDGTLVRGDLLWDGIVQLCARRPALLPALVVAGLRGPAALKAFVAGRAGVATDTVPLEPATLRLIEAARAEGRPVILASGAHQTQVAELGVRVRADLA